LKHIHKFIVPEVNDLKLNDSFVEPGIQEDLTFQDILVIAMKNEEKVKNLYTELANQVDDVAIKNLFLKLATEESKHKLQLETMYDEEINYEF